MPETEIAWTILGLEREALRRWVHGDADGFLEITDPHVTYFDPFVEKRVDGIAALTALYHRIRGGVRIERYEMIEPKVQHLGDTAVLTFIFDSHTPAGSERWNTTEVYRRTETGWRIVHTHWAINQPKLVDSAA